MRRHRMSYCNRAAYMGQFRQGRAHSYFVDLARPSTSNKLQDSGTMSSFSNGAAPTVEGLLGQIVSRLLSAEGAETPVVVSACQPDDQVPSSLPVAGLPAEWERQVVSWDQMAATTGAALADRSRVFVIPPWGRRELQPHEQGRQIRRGSECAQTPRRPPLEFQEEFLLDCSAPDRDVKLFVLLPASTVRSERTRQLRSGVMGEWRVTDVVFLQGVIAGVHSSFECVLLGLRPSEYADPLTRFVDAGIRPDPTVLLADLGRLQKMKGGETQFGYVMRGELEAGTSLAYGLRDPRLEAKREDLAHFGRAVTLEELFEIRRPALHPLVHKSQFCSAETPRAVRVISGRELGRDGELSKPEPDGNWIVPDGTDVLQSGDVLIRSMISRSDRHGFTVVPLGADTPVVATYGVLVLRPLEHVPADIINFAVSYLRSSASKELYFAFNGGNHQLGRDFGLLTVPVPDDEILLAIQNLKDAKTNFLEWAEEAGRVIGSIFEFPSIREARPQIIAAGRRVRWRSREARNLDDPDFVVRRAFPYPIAHRWRVMEAALSSGTPGAGYTAILDTAESILGFLAQVTLALSTSSGIDVKVLGPIRGKLQGGSGPGMGDWAAILQETTGKHFSVSSLQGGLADVIDMFRTPDVEAARVTLSRRRNDEAHNRRVEPTDMEDAINSALADLRTLTKAAGFLVDMPLRHVTETSWDSFLREATVTYREMIGDHWVVKSQTTQVATNELERDSLYVVDPEGHWHLLRPFLVVRDCPRCRSISTFHVDALEKGKVRLKSLENGHTVVDDKEVPALKRVGLL
jgi:hypothetical protein